MILTQTATMYKFSVNQYQLSAIIACIMPMLEAKELERRRHKRDKAQKRKKRSFGLLPAVIVVLLIYVIVVSVMPLAALQVQTSSIEIPTKPATQLPWPGYGQAALGAVGYGMLAQHGDPKPLPIASVAKVITALAVLKKRPINKGQPLPIITITAEDVAVYKQYAAQDQSVVEVQAGEQITEYQALQALLLPSANNMADILVRWAFGSNDDYLKFANPFARTVGMKNTHVDDASGYSPKTVSTAEDLTKLAEIATSHPLIAEIVNQAQADIPVAGTVYNVNKLVGHDGIIGIKTGNTDEAGGCYMFSVRRSVDADHQVTLVGTIMGAVSLSAAIDDALPLIDAAFKLFRKSDVVHASQIFGKVERPDGGSVPLVAKDNLSIVVWDNHAPKIAVETTTLGTSAKQDDEIGHLEITNGDMSYTMPLVSSETIKPASYSWRIRHAGGYL